ARRAYRSFGGLLSCVAFPAPCSCAGVRWTARDRQPNEVRIVDLAVPVEHRFHRTPDGTVWTQAQLLHAFWAPYLSGFDHRRVIGGVCDVPAVPADWKRADGPGVTIAAVPYYVGPWQYLRQSSQIRRAACEAIGPTDAVILRGGSPFIDAVEGMLHRSNR